MVYRWKVRWDEDHVAADPNGEYVLHSDYAAMQAKADRLARLLRNFTIFDWREELKGSQFHPEDVDRIELDAMEAVAALAAYREGE